MSYREKPCRECQAVFTPYSGRSLYCSVRCRNVVAYRNRKSDPDYMKKHRDSERLRYRANKAEINAKRRVSRNSPEYRQRIREQNIKHYWSNRGPRIENAVRWQRENPDRVSARAGKRKAREAGYTVSKRFQKRQLARQNGMCAYCGVKLGANGRSKPSSLQWDHVIPLSRGGTHSEGNLVASCRDCNLRKGRRTVMEFRVRDRV